MFCSQATGGLGTWAPKGFAGRDSLAPMPRLIQSAPTWGGKGPIACLSVGGEDIGAWVGASGGVWQPPSSLCCLQGLGCDPSFYTFWHWVFVAKWGPHPLWPAGFPSLGPTGMRHPERVLDRFLPWAGHRQQSEPPRLTL